MKNAIRIFLSLVIAVAAVCMVFSFNAVDVKAVDDNNEGGGGDVGGLVGGSVHQFIYMYKVTVYSDPNNKVTKESDISQFPVKVTKYFWNSAEGNATNSSIICTKNKLEYVKDPGKLKAAKIEDVGRDILIATNVPEVSMENTKSLSNMKSTIEKYFAGDNNEKCYSVVKKIASSVKEDDSWVLIVEPVIRSYVNKEVRLFTPTEYAVAMKCSGQSYAVDSFKYKLGSLTLQVPGQISYMRDGTWLGVSSNSAVSNTWYTLNYSNDKNGNNRNAFMNQVDNFIKYAGVFMWFSKSFENSDFTLGSVPENTEKFEEEEITISTQVTRTNPGKAGTVNATLELDDSGISGAAILDEEVTKAVSFAQGEDSKTVSWKVKVGSYGDYSTNRSYKYNINILPAEGTKDLDMNNNTVSGQITLKRDFRVENVSLNQTECFENSNVTVKFSVRNANPYKEYKEVPVTIYFLYGGGKVKIGEVEVDFGKDGKKTGSCTINVGCVTDNSDQYDSVVVVLNSYNEKAESGRRYTEPEMSNNIGSVGVKVKRDINLSVSIVNRDSWEDIIGNAPSKVKNAGSTQAITTCAVKNNSRFNLYSADPMGDVITVTFYVNDKKIGSKTVDIPRYGSNLVWFKWDVPEGSSVTLRAEISWNINQESAPSPHTDNQASITKAIKNVNEFDTPDTKLLLEYGSNRNYMTASGYSKFKPSVAKWSQWICDNNGTFTRIDYAMTGDSALTLTPMVSAEYYDGNTIASGSAISAVFSYTVRTECSEAGYNVSENDYTYAQNVVAMFPEFQYSSSGDCRTMYLVSKDGNLKNASFEFEENPYIEDKQRVHFTPSNMPDGEYKVGVVASQMWTPAGPIYVNAASSLMINGTVYGDWSPNASVKG